MVGHTLHLQHEQKKRSTNNNTHNCATNKPKITHADLIKNKNTKKETHLNLRTRDARFTARGPKAEAAPDAPGELNPYHAPSGNTPTAEALQLTLL